MKKDLITVETPRSMCWKCYRPASGCFCSHLDTVDSQTRIIILAHPKEDRRKMSTGRMTHLSLPNSIYIIDESFDSNPNLLKSLSDDSYESFLLFPGENAQEIGELKQESAQRPKQILLIEATWHNAKSIYRKSPLLQGLPKAAFVAPRPSRFRIRTQPAPMCLSTIEATELVLRELGEDTGAMLRAFDYLVESQISMQVENNPGHLRKWESD